MKKKLFSIFLICCVLFTMLPTVAFATEQIEALPPEQPVQYVSYVQTDIEADSVFNSGGYGSLLVRESWQSPDELKSFPKAALIDRNGTFLFPYKETWFRYRYSDGVVSLTADNHYNSYNIGTSYSWETELPGFYTLDGTALFQNTYKNATPMIDGYAFVMDGYDWDNSLNAYLIDRTGAVVYTFPENFRTGVSAGFGVWSDGFNTRMQCGWPSEGLIGYGTVLDPCDWEFRHEGYRNMAGEIVITSTGYDNGYPFYEGLAGVRSAESGKYGFINTSGVEVIPCRYDDVSGFCDGYAAAKKDGKWGYISKNGEAVIPFEYDDAYGAGGGLFSVVKDGKCGMVNVKNEVVVPFEYDDISSCEGGVAYAIKDGKLVIIKPMLNLFVDVKSTDYFCDAVLWAAENGITMGTDAVHFSPDMDTTRAQAVTFLWRAAGCPETEHTASVFKDVSPDAYYAKAVAWALSEGITKGTSDTTFNPDAVCTRGQIVTFLARFAGVEDTDTASVFSDVNTTDYFAAAVKWAKDNGVTEGTSASTFSPDAVCTRAQVVTFLYRWIVK